MKIIFSHKCLDYESYGHPESPLRIKSAHKLLKEKSFEFVEACPCQEEDVLGVHGKQLLKKIKNGEFLDLDTPNLEGIFSYAMLSCGAAIQAAEFALKGKHAFSLMRPPGHHASRNNSAGFCYLNNIAIAVSRVLGVLKRVAIIDIDCHHGNGTQDIFLGDKRVLYVSLHQSPLYPGTGLSSIRNCINFPLPAGTDEEAYLAVLKEAIRKARDFDPQILAVSAGFDTYRGDPLGNLKLEKESYGRISGALASLNIPSFSVLEGGYNISALSECIAQYLMGF